MRKLAILFTTFLLVYINTAAQTGVSIGANSAPHASAMLDIKGNNKGVLIPRVSANARKAIANPATGLMVFDSTEGTLYMFDGARWLGFQGMPDNIRPTSKLLLPPDNQDTLFAGYSVAISGEFAVIGAPYRDLPASKSGGAYVYRKNNGHWYHFTTLTPSSGAVDTALFGQSVNICGNNIIIGAPLKKNATGQRIGAAYIFTFDGTAWTNSQILWGTVEGTSFGNVVDIDQSGTHAAVSEPGATASGLAGAGVIRVYHKTASWFLHSSLSDQSSPHAGEGFGTTMAMSPGGTYIIGGAPGKTVSGLNNNGHVSIFNRPTSIWLHMVSFQNGGSAGMQLGQNVDITNTHVLITEGGTRTVRHMKLETPWSFFPHVYPNFIDGASIDPVTGDFYVWTPSTLYRNGMDIAKRFSTTEQVYNMPNIFAIHDFEFVLGQPGEQGPGGVWAGGFYFGVANQ